MKEENNKIILIKKFIETNHDLVEKYFNCYYRRFSEKDDWREQLRILFINAINSGGIGKIEQKAKSLEKFQKKLNQMKSPSYDDLLIVFNINDYNGLFDQLKKFKQIGPKKAALFLRDILFYKNIITETSHSIVKELLVPVDRVIIRTLNSIFGEDFKKNPFDEINTFAKKIFPEKPIMLEDMWFWGRFYRCDEKKKSDIPYCEFNKNLLLMDINATKEYRIELLNFSEIQRKCPFKKICSKVNL